MTNTRRELLRTLSAGGAAVAIGGCGSLRPPQVPPPPLLSAEDQALKVRFAVLHGGGQLVVDALSLKEGINIFDETGRVFFAQSATGPRGKSFMSYGAKFGVPKTLRVIWRTGEDIRPDIYRLYSGGTIVGDYTVPVASRIPDDLLQDLRSNPGGGFRLKIRLHDDGVLIGWDIERRPGFDPKKRDQWGEAVYVGPVHSFAGGDFREAEIFNGKPVRMGWYIHPKTGERIETDR